MAVGWPTGMTVCVSMLMWSVHHLQCVCALSVSVNNLQVYACWSLFWAALVTESEREAEELSIFSRGIATEKICLGGTVITSLFSPPSSVPLSPICLEYTRYLSIHLSILPLPHPSQSLGLNKACDVLSLSSISGCQHISEEYVSKFVRLRKRVFIF